ncbi:MAG: aminodeoxychorismate/anthranilate synthase component II [Methanocellales archaeon]
MKVLFINNFDSFTWNLVDYVSIFESNTIVVDNTISLEAVRRIDPDAIVISPGPGHPARRADIGNCIEIIREFGEKIPILGVCLGHQAICVAYNGEVSHSILGPLHGKTSLIVHDGKRIYRNVANPLIAGRYHSLSAQKIPRDLKVVAMSDDGEVMGLRHRKNLVEGVQFHPESVLTPEGLKIIKNFLELAR